VIQILLADDNEFVRTALVELFDSTGDITVVAECGDGDQVLAAVRETTPDVVVLDLAMPGRTGLQAARVLLSVDPGARSSCSRVTRPRPRSGRRRRSACRATSSREDPAELVDYVRTVAAGGTAWSQAVFRTGDGETGGSPSQNESQTFLRRATTRTRRGSEHHQLSAGRRRAGGGALSLGRRRNQAAGRVRRRPVRRRSRPRAGACSRTARDGRRSACGLRMVAAAAGIPPHGGPADQRASHRDGPHPPA
jgi:DNA-binding NarL/FixJ family response regulator